jgi:hypothetical protein
MLRCFVRFEHTFLAKMREQFSARYKLHEHIEMPGILGETIEVDLNKSIYTMNG